MRAAGIRLVPLIALGVVPVVAIIVMFVVAIGSDSLALDFQNEIYPEAKEVLAGTNPFPTPQADLSRGSNHIWPPFVAYLAAPLTLLPVGAANIVVALGGLLCFAAALWIVGVRDWRVYGAAALWAPVIGEMRTAHLTLILCLLVAVSWRFRERAWIPAVAVGLTISLKFLLWPLAFWLACRRRYKEAAVALGIAATSLLLLLPFIGILDYVALLRRLSEVFDQESYSPYGLLLQAGASDLAARVIALAIAASVLVLAWRRHSFALFVGAALLFSPIVWLDYYALLAIPLAVVRPTFALAWLLPVLTWGLPAAGAGIGHAGGSIRVLVVFGALLWYTARLEQRDARAEPAYSTAPNRA